MVVQNGEQLPPIMGRLVDGDGSAQPLSDLVSGSWGVIQLYRGHW